MTGNVVALPGDGVGPEVIDEAERLLAVIAPDLRVERYPFGGAAIDELGDPLPPESLTGRSGGPCGPGHVP